MTHFHAKRHLSLLVLVVAFAVSTAARHSHLHQRNTIPSLAHDSTVDPAEVFTTCPNVDCRENIGAVCGQIGSTYEYCGRPDGVCNMTANMRTGLCVTTPTEGSSCVGSTSSFDLCNKPTREGGILKCGAEKRCVRIRYPGDKCSIDSDCQFTGTKKCANGVCQGLAFHKTCDPNADNQCDKGLICSNCPDCSSCKCANKVDVGRFCVYHNCTTAGIIDNCGPGARCNFDASDQPTCQSFFSLSTGTKVSEGMDLLCKTMYRNGQGLCAERPTFAAKSCTTTADCVVPGSTESWPCECTTNAVNNTKQCKNVKSIIPAAMQHTVSGVLDCARKFQCSIGPQSYLWPAAVESCLAENCQEELKQHYCQLSVYYQSSGSHDSDQPCTEFSKLAAYATDECEAGDSPSGNTVPLGIVLGLSGVGLTLLLVLGVCIRRRLRLRRYEIEENEVDELVRRYTAEDEYDSLR